MHTNIFTLWDVVGIPLVSLPKSITAKIILFYFVCILLIYFNYNKAITNMP